MPPRRHLTHLTGGRVALRPIGLQDVPAVMSYATDPETMRYLRRRPNADEPATRAFVEDRIRAWESGEAATWAITVTADGAEAFRGVLEARFGAHGVELGYVVVRSAWGQGLATEAVGLATEHLLAEPDVFRVWAYTDVDNLASRRVLERGGFVAEGTLHRYVVHPNISSEPRDAVLFARWR